MIKATLTTAETAKIMRECGIPKDTQTLCQQIEEGFYPFAKCMNMKSNSRYFEIYKKDFARFIAKKVGLKVIYDDPVEDYFPEPVEVIKGVFISRFEKEDKEALRSNYEVKGKEGKRRRCSRRSRRRSGTSRSIGNVSRRRPRI